MQLTAARIGAVKGDDEQGGPRIGRRQWLRSASRTTAAACGLAFLPVSIQKALAIAADRVTVSVGAKIEGHVVEIIEGVDQANRWTLVRDAARPIQKGISSSSWSRSRSRTAS
jgi:hypothetical protein